MTEAHEESVRQTFIELVQSVIIAITKTSKKRDSKAIFHYITTKYTSSTTESTITDYTTTLKWQNLLINTPTLKGDSYFVIIENDNLNNDSLSGDENVENSDQTPMYVEHNTPTKNFAKPILTQARHDNFHEVQQCYNSRIYGIKIIGTR